MSPRTALCLLMFVSASTELARAEHRPAELSDAAKYLFAWFDTLGFEDLAQARLARVSLGNVSYVGHEKMRQADEPRGYVLADGGREFRAALSDLTVVRLQKTGKN